jgi:hypothetical protein
MNVKKMACNYLKKCVILYGCSTYQQITDKVTGVQYLAIAGFLPPSHQRKLYGSSNPITNDNRELISWG